MKSAIALTVSLTIFLALGMVPVANAQAIYEDFIGWKKQTRQEPIRVWIVSNPNNPCAPQPNFKYQVRHYMLTGEDACEWLVSRGLMNKIGQRRYKWTAMYEDWQNAKALNSLYWQRCSEGNDPVDPAKVRHQNFCRDYAQRAVAQANQQLARGCGKNPTGRWTTNYDNHYNWCMGVTESAANYEEQGRLNFLRVSCP